MNLAIKRGLLILSVTSAIVTTFSSTAIAGTEGKQQYYCKGNHGDDNDRGLWDYIFTASSKADAESQAEKQYKVDGPNAFVNIKECTLQN